MDKFKATSLAVVYAISLFITVLLIAVSVGDTLRGKELSVAVIVIGVFFGFISFYLKRQIARSKDDVIENNTLNMAVSNGGFVTAFEIAAHHSLRLKDVNRYLQKCCESGICEKRYTEDDLVEVFYFKASISLDAKKTSKPKSDV